MDGIVSDFPNVVALADTDVTRWLRALRSLLVVEAVCGMYRTSQVYSDGSNPNARWSQNHLVKELSKTLSEDSRKKLYVCGRLPPLLRVR